MWWLATAVAGIACGGGAAAVGAHGEAATARSESLDHEACSDSGHRVDAMDTNGDGKPDIRRIFDKGTGRELCRVVDLNRDGKPDLYEYFDAAGNVRRRELSYDDTGAVEAIEYFDKGKLVRREIDATGHRKIDTWDWFDPSAALDPKTGRPAHPTRRERDTKGSGHVDQWWTWNGDKVTIAVDSTGDGTPDPDSTIVLGADNTVQDPSSSPGAAASSSAAISPVASASPEAAGGDAGASASSAQPDGGKP